MCHVSAGNTQTPLDLQGGAEWKGRGRAKGGRRRAEAGTGTRGQPAAWDTCCREIFPAVSHGKGKVSSGSSEAPCHLLFMGLPTQLCRGGPQGRERPGLLPFLPLTNQSNLCLSPPTTTTTISNSPGEQSSQELFLAVSQVNSRCVQLGLVCPRPWSFYLPEEGIGQAGKTEV